MNAIDFKMWGRALKTIPRISKDEWLRIDIVSKWLIATRSAVFIMTVIAGAVGGILAWYNGSFNGLNFLVAIIGLVFAHASNNLLNDLVDSRKGIDKGNYYRSLYGPQTVEHGLLSTAGIYGYIGFSILVAVLCGIFLISRTDAGTLYLMLAGLFFLFFYTWPLKYFGLGEITVALVWGPLMVGGTYYVTSGGDWSWTAAVVGIIYALGPTSVLFGKHTDKLKEDKVKRVFTLPVILGEKNSRWSTIFMWVAQYFLVGWLVYIGSLGYAMTIVLFAIPKLIQVAKVFSKPRPESEPETLEKGVWPLYLSANAFMYNKRFGLLFLLGLMIDLMVTKSGIL